MASSTRRRPNAAAAASPSSPLSEASSPLASASSPSPETSSTTATPPALTSTLRGAAYLLLLQLTSRLGTFILNNAIQRVSAIHTVGLASDLELLNGTILFLSRENVRMAVLRSGAEGEAGEGRREREEGGRGEAHGSGRTVTSEAESSTDSLPLPPHLRQKLINLSYIPLLLGLSLTLLAHHFSLPSEGPSPSTHPLLLTLSSPATPLYLLATLLELLSEPFYILIQTSLLYAVRAKIEGVALLVKCVVTFVITFVGGAGIGAFAWGQVAYGGVLLAGYAAAVAARAGRERGHVSGLIHIITPRPLTNTRPHTYFDGYLLSVAWSFTAMSGLKYVLTEADRLALLGMGVGWEGKGGYRVVCDLGSLVARILFQPIEETARAFFSATLAKDATGDATTPQHENETQRQQNQKQKKQEAKHLLLTLLRFHIHLGAFFIFLAPNYTDTLMRLLYGRRSSSSSSVASSPPTAASPRLSTTPADLLSLYTLYIPLLALNGILEAFVQGVGDKRVLRWVSGGWVAGTGVFGGVAWGVRGLLTAPATGQSTAGRGGASTNGDAARRWAPTFWPLPQMDPSSAAPVALIVANMAGMAVRIAVAWRIVRRFFAVADNDDNDTPPPRRTPNPNPISVRSILPANIATVLALVLSCVLTHPRYGLMALVTSSSPDPAEWGWNLRAVHVLVGAVCAGGVLGCMYVGERGRLVRDVRGFWRVSRGRKMQ
ncbi:Rft protein-domain-containing protein [Fimicolochytrium jonesii]|uniref:Rft protein-domain-containing protein n=1 Tax=Fimicolochytrium jonesii TaxID=1396493 RepID=UPI0022FEC528|nr:Rft protein-domain-containing protein [Fimicolochytrium jonesii]KAI8816254.1 Rft protein-domain-containing protein [Fimicolochytrium jonesii]